jgi:hypothetical protein
MTPRLGLFIVDGHFHRSSALTHLARVLALGLLVAFLAPGAFAQQVSRDQMKGLDEQVQEIKADVLAIAAELSQLEERLLFPSGTQVAVFVALEEGAAYRLDAVQVRIDDRAVAHHIYSYKELEALQKGGVQRIYTGNVPTGERQLEVTVSGKLPSGRDFSRSETFRFTKDVEPKLIGLTLGGAEAGAVGISLGDW